MPAQPLLQFSTVPPAGARVVRRFSRSFVVPCAVSLVVAVGAVECVLAQGPGTAQSPPAPGQQPTSRVATVPPPPQVPAPLSQQEQAALEQLLSAWEARNAAVSTWSCTFFKWEYNAWSPPDPKGGQLAVAESVGELKYAAPDKGLFRVKESKKLNLDNGRYDMVPSEELEYWVCNGESIFQFRHTEKQLVETRLPPEMRGKAISDGPLPFVFGAKADTLKKRYWMRIITPPEVRDQIWLEALPRYQADAANFSKVELILHARDLMPFAIRIFKPGSKDQDVYQFAPQTNLINKALDMINDFSKPRTPFGYKYVLDDAQSGPPPAAGSGR
jgi:TIGR03009 family protein